VQHKDDAFQRGKAKFLNSMTRRLTSLFLFLAGLAKVSGQSLFIDYSPKPNAAELLKHELCILDPHAEVDLKPAQQKGHRILAYLSLVELAQGSPAAAKAEQRQVPYVGKNQAWASHLLDVQSAAWRAFMIDDCAASAVAQGFDGFFLDTADSVQRLSDPKAGGRALADLIRQLHQRWPKKSIVLNRGFELLPELKDVLSGVLVESVYQGFDPTTKRYRAVDPQGSEWLEARIHEAQALGLAVYAVDYVHPVQKALARRTAERLKKLGCTPLITTHELRGTVLASRADE